MSSLEKGITSQGETKRGYDKYGERHWEANPMDVAKGKDPLSSHKPISASDGKSMPKGADSDTKRTKVA